MSRVEKGWQPDKRVKTNGSRLRSPPFWLHLRRLTRDNSFDSSSKILKREGEKEHLYSDLSKHRIGKGSYLSIILRLS